MNNNYKIIGRTRQKIGLFQKENNLLIFQGTFHSSSEFGTLKNVVDFTFASNTQACGRN